MRIILEIIDQLLVLKHRKLLNTRQRYYFLCFDSNFLWNKLHKPFVFPLYLEKNECVCRLRDNHVENCESK